MQIEVKSTEFLHLYPEVTDETLKKANQANLEMTMQSDGLFLMLNKKPAAKFNCTILQCDTFDTKSILYTMKGKQKYIILEVIGNEEQSSQLAKWVKRRNAMLGYKSPLQLEFASAVRDSILTSADKTVNLRGLINLFIIFSILIYSRLILEHSIKYGIIFSKSVSLEAWRIYRQHDG